MEKTDTKLVKARKAHKCNKCNGVIEPKDTYELNTLWQELDFPTYWKVCSTCISQRATNG